MIASADLVLAHWSARGMVGAEIFRLSDGRIVERWGVTQPMPEPTVSGHDMVSQLTA